MRFIFRVIGTWLLGVALVLVIIDGTRSLGANQLVISSLGESWALVHGESLAASQQWLAVNMPEFVRTLIVDSLLGWPGWAVLAVPGLFFALTGRSRRVREDRFNQV
jgi:hypothetical protein